MNKFKINLKNHFKIIVIILISLILVSCGKSDLPTIKHNYKSGTPQLEVEFLKNSPPTKIYENSEFSMVLSLENKMAYDLEDGVIKIMGINEKYFAIFPLEYTFSNLPGRSSTTPTGGIENIEFTGKSKELFQNAEKYSADYFLDIKYNSKFNFADTICINSNLYDTYDGGCKVEAKKIYSGQGAPVAITELEEIVSSGIEPKIELRFKLRNRGKGKLSQVSLEKASLGNTPIICRFQGGTATQIVFTDKKQEATVICKKVIEEKVNFHTTISLNFAYEYKISQKKKLNLIK